MARKMTFTLPDELASRFVRRIAARDRSQYVARAIAERLRESEERLINSCIAANSDPEVLALERDWGSLPHEVEEPWSDAPTR